MVDLIVIIYASLVITWIGINAVPIVQFIIQYDGAIYNFEEAYGSPKYIYDNSELNWFGIIVLFLGLLLLCPMYYLMMGLYWLFHVGRR